LSTNAPLAVGDRVRRVRVGQRPGLVIRIAQEQPYQMVEVSWDLVARPFDRVVMPASQLKRISADRHPSSVNPRHFGIGDRVERLGIKRRPSRGTVVRIIQENPQVVEVSWDSEGTPRLTPEMSQALRLVPKEPR
jgi:hypothetical protein